MMIYISIEATNASGETFAVVSNIKFSNECAVYPVLTVGDTIGLVDFVSFQ